MLDDVIQLHNKHIGVSIFTESMKAYVHTTVTNLIEVIKHIERSKLEDKCDSLNENRLVYPFPVVTRKRRWCNRLEESIPV